MLDFSWSELMVVIVVAVIAIGPKQLPEVLHGLGRIVRRLQYMRYALSRQFDDFMEESDLKQLRDTTPMPRIIPADMLDEAAHDEPAAEMKPKQGEADDAGKS
jgi:sec-independent protein translocase protein TatB